MILLNSHYSVVKQYTSQHSREYFQKTSNTAFHGYLFFQLLTSTCWSPVTHTHYLFTHTLHNGCKCTLYLCFSLAMQINTPWAAHLEQWQLDHLPISHCSPTTGMAESRNRVYGLAHQWGWQKNTADSPAHSFINPGYFLINHMALICLSLHTTASLWRCMSFSIFILAIIDCTCNNAVKRLPDSR